jgi:hypothetical protein
MEMHNTDLLLVHDTSWSDPFNNSTKGQKRLDFIFGDVIWNNDGCFLLQSHVEHCGAVTETHLCRTPCQCRT